MEIPRVAVVSFPGNNCEVESIRALRCGGMEPLYFRWNDDRDLLVEVDAYFLPGGFSYEDRGRSGMVAARDPLLTFIGREAEEGKAVIGHCNGAQVLVESGLIPLGKGLRMALARNVIGEGSRHRAVGFLNEWVWIVPSCRVDRCATSGWNGPMHLPIAHGEGRFTTSDPDLLAALREHDQIAFSYCDASGAISDVPDVTPNGSLWAIAGICNPSGNVVALMPHPERTQNGDPYFAALRQWLILKARKAKPAQRLLPAVFPPIQSRSPRETEIFVETIIVNNEERTVEQTARRIVPNVSLKQMRYIAPGDHDVRRILMAIAFFNRNKEHAYVRRRGKLFRWNAERREEEPLAGPHADVFRSVVFLRRDVPDTGAEALGEGSETGICTFCTGLDERYACNTFFLEILCNPHASTLERIEASGG